MIELLETDAIRDKNDNRRLLHQKRRHKLTERNHQKVHVADGKFFWNKKPNSVSTFREGKYNNLSSNYWHPPMCPNYKCETGCTFGYGCYFGHVEAEEKPSKKSKKGGAEGSVALLKESIQLGCVSQDSHPKIYFPREEGKLASNRTVRFSKGAWQHITIREKWSIQLCVNFTSAIRALPDLRKGHQTKPCTMIDAPAEKHGNCRKCLQGQKYR